MNRYWYIFIIVSIFLSSCATIKNHKTIQSSHESKDRVVNTCKEYGRFDYIFEELMENCHSKSLSILKFDKYLKIDIDGDMSFKPHLFELSKVAQKDIECISEFIKHDDDLVVQTVGYSNDSISLNHNQYLSNERAISVAEKFADNGIKDDVYAIGCPTKKKINSGYEYIDRDVNIYIYEDRSYIKNPCK